MLFDSQLENLTARVHQRRIPYQLESLTAGMHLQQTGLVLLLLLLLKTEPRLLQMHPYILPCITIGELDKRPVFGPHIIP